MSKGSHIDKAKVAGHRRIERVQTWSSITGVVFFAIIGGAVLAFFSVISGPGSGPDRMFDGLILIPILVIGAVGALVAGVVWLFLRAHVRDLKSESTSSESEAKDA